jgi:hypothetical protein
VDVGDVIPMRATFRDADGIPGDPTEVLLRVQDPAGIIVTPNPDNPVPGTYVHYQAALLPGVYRWEYRATGGITEADSGEAYVRRPRVVA